MNIVQTRLQETWTQVEPYAMPAGVAVGSALVINQLWGSVAAASFAAALVIAGTTFPHLITEITEQDLALGGARIVLMAVMPFFGAWGIIASLCLGAVSSFTQDIRLYSIRRDVKENIRLANEIKREREELIQQRIAMVEECEQKCREAEEFWQRQQPVNAVSESIARYEALTEENRRFFENALNNPEFQNRTDEAKELVDQLEELKAYVLTLAAENRQLTEQVLRIQGKEEAHGLI